MKYLDTNVIVYAIENHPKYGGVCIKILEDINNEKIKVCSSIVVLVEIINVLKKINKILEKGGKTALNIRNNIDAILSLPIVWFDLNFLIIKKSAEYDYNISGADYAHIATMDLHSIATIISADMELDKVDIIKRLDPLDYK